MSLKVAVTGKGGVGKSTVAGGLARLFGRQGKRSVAIDADPDGNLAATMGVPPEIRRSLVPLSEMLDLIEERTGARPGGQYGAFFRMNPRVDDLLDRFGVDAGDNAKLLVLGTIDVPGSGCFCPEHALIRALLRHLVLKEDDYLFMDMEAGIEHLGRGTTEGMDALLVVVEPGSRSMETAAKIARLGRQAGIRRILAVLNKSRSPEQRGQIEAELKRLEIPLIGVLPYDEAAVNADLRGLSIFDLEETPALLQALEDFAGVLEDHLA